MASACGEPKGDSIRFEVRHWSPSFGGEFANGDFIARGRRIDADRVTVVDENHPGLECTHLMPGVDDTQFLQCAKLYSRVGDGDWQEVLTPDAAAEFVGQDESGARYFYTRRAAPETTHLLWVLPRGATGFLKPIEFPSDALPFVHMNGRFYMSKVAPYRFWRAEKSGQREGDYYQLKNGELTAPVRASFIDFKGYFYRANELAGWDRVSPDGAQKEALYFKRPEKNQIHAVAGVGSDGRLYALAIAKTNISNDSRPENTFEIDTLMSMGPGDSDWLAVSEPFSTAESRVVVANEWRDAELVMPGRSDSWWFGVCIANCSPNGANKAHQSEILQWRKPGAVKHSTFRNRFTVWRESAVTVPMPGPNASTLTWSPRTALDALGLADCGSSAKAICIKAGPTATTGKHQLSYAAPSGFADKTIELEVKGTDAVPLAEPRRIVIQERLITGRFDGALLWLDASGTVHQRTTTVADAPVAGLPSGIRSIERQPVVNAQNQETQVERMLAHTNDGRIYRLEVDASGLMQASAPLALPAMHSMHAGLGLTAEGAVYRLHDNAQPIPGLTNIVHLSAVYTTAFAPNAVMQLDFRALDQNGQSYLGYHRESFTAPPVIETGSRSLLWRRVGPQIGNLDAEGVAVHDSGHRYGAAGSMQAAELVQTEGTITQSSLQGMGARVVTTAGEVWNTAVISEGFSRFDIATPDKIVPAGRRAVAVQGKYVWLDDGRIIYRDAADGAVKALNLGSVALPAP